MGLGHSMIEKTKRQEHIEKVRAVVTEDLVTGDDGFKVYWPSTAKGYLTAYDLRVVADYLDELNAPWQQQMDEYFINVTPNVD